jgi:predicted RNase H-like HicB family nuclease
LNFSLFQNSHVINTVGYEERLPENSDYSKVSVCECVRVMEVKSMRIKATEEIWKEGNMYVSYCPELDMASCGESVEESKKNLKEVIAINFAECRKMGALNQLLQDAGFTEDHDNVLLARKELVSFSLLEVGV